MAVKVRDEINYRLMTPKQKKAYKVMQSVGGPVDIEYMYAHGFSTSTMVSLRTKGLVKVNPDGTYSLL